MRSILALAVLLAGGSAFADDVPLPRSRPHIRAEPQSFAEAAQGIFDASELSTQVSDCRKRLVEIALVDPLPRLIGPGACGGSDMVRLKAVLMPDKSQIPVQPPPQLRCSMAEGVAQWVRDDVAPKFADAKVAGGGSALRSIENYDSFECRGRNRVVGAKLSEHGMGNALDVRFFRLANGKSFDPTDIHAAKEMREALKLAACSRFMTVLGPGSDSYHESHIHLDLAERRGGYRMCQWAVREPPPPPPQPAAPVTPPSPTTPEGAVVAARTADPDADNADELEESNVPAISGQVPLPPRKPRFLRRAGGNDRYRL